MEVEPSAPSSSAGNAATTRKFNYVVSAYNSTSVTNSFVASLLNASEYCLVVAHPTSIEIHELTPSGLIWKHMINVYGRIASIGAISHPGALDWLYFLTEKLDLSVVKYNPASETFETCSCGHMSEKYGKEVESIIVRNDPNSRFIALSIYEGLLKIVPVANREFNQEAFTIRIEDVKILDWRFLNTSKSSPALAVLSVHQNDQRQIRTYELDPTQKELKYLTATKIVDVTAHLLIPLPSPVGGFIVMSETSMSYHNGDYSISVNKNLIDISTSYSLVDPDGQRIIVGNTQGVLSIIVIKVVDLRVVGMEMQRLGMINPPSSVSYLDNGFVFVGSQMGNSQLIKIQTEKGENDSYTELIQEYDNLGPITDLVVVELEKGGQTQLVACSGGLETGALKVIQNGIGINEFARVDLPGIQGVWSFEITKEDTVLRYLVITFAEQSHLLLMSDNQLVDGEINGFDCSSRTLHASLTPSNHILQITEDAVRLINTSTFEVVNVWSETEKKITVCSVNKSQVAVVIDGDSIVILQVQETITELSRKKMENEISALAFDDADVSSVCVVGLWRGGALKVLSVPDLDEKHSEDLSSETIPRSLIFANFDDSPHLLCGLGDGQLYSFKFDTAASTFSEKKKASIGTKPLLLTKFGNTKIPHVLVCSDFPTILSSSNRRINYSNVNLNNISHACNFGSDASSQNVAVVVENQLILGSIDTIQKLHVRSYPIQEIPRRLVFHEDSRTLAVGTFSVEYEESSVNETGRLHLFDVQTFEKISTFDFGPQENFSSITTAKLQGDTTYIVVGTAIVLPDEDIPKTGFIYVFSVNQMKLEKLCHIQVPGAVYAVEFFQGKILASVNSKVSLFEYSTAADSPTLTHECSFDGHVHSIYLAHRGHFVLVGDLIRSASLLAYKPQEKALEMIAEEKQSRWLSAVDILDDDTFILGDSFGNLVTLQRNNESIAEEDRSKLDVIGRYHSAGMINCFQQGSLSLRLSEENHYPTSIFGTVDGCIGLVISISEQDYKILEQVQNNLRELVKGFGGLKHESFRSFKDDRVTLPSTGFLDGDLLEEFLQLPRPRMELVLKDLHVSVDEVTKLLSDLSRLH